MQPRVFFSPRYDISFYGLESLHPFDSHKYIKIWKQLEKDWGELQRWLEEPKYPANIDELLRIVHTAEYLNNLNNPVYLAKALEIPILELVPTWLNWILDKRILEPMRWATAGTIRAAEAAIKHGIAVNLAGGYHHATKNQGGGFCIFADIAIAIEHLRKSGMLTEGVDKILIVDLDAHQGNGLERIFLKDKDVYILDMYNEDIYPQDTFAKKRIDCDIAIASHTDDEQYQNKLEEELPRFLKGIHQPKIAFYNAGTDIYEGDPLGRLNVSESGIFNRDRFVFDTLTDAGVPWVMVLSGGYTKHSYALVARSVNYIITTWGGKEYD